MPVVMDGDRLSRSLTRIAHEIVEIERNVRAAYQRLRPDRLAHQVVAVERDVERSRRDFVARDLTQRTGDTTGDGHAARTHADQRQIFDAFVSFDDFVSDSSEGAADAVRIHDDGHVHLFAASRDRG